MAGMKIIPLIAKAQRQADLAEAVATAQQPLLEAIARDIKDLDARVLDLETAIEDLRQRAPL